MTIFVGNLYWETTADELEQLFAPYGTIERVEILVDRVTGRSRGFGFVEMPNSTEAQAAMTVLNGASLGGRPLTVSEARPRAGRRPQDDGDRRRRPRW
jgi:cold-inducible RNA-binding protein